MEGDTIDSGQTCWNIDTTGGGGDDKKLFDMALNGYWAGNATSGETYCCYWFRSFGSFVGI